MYYHMYKDNIWRPKIFINKGVSLIKTELFIDGQYIPSETRRTFDVINPVNAQPMGQAAKASTADVEHALEAAQTAFKKWSRTNGDERAARLKTAAAAIRDHEQELAHILTAEHGKPLNDALKEIQGTASAFEYYGEEARRISGEIAPAKSATSRSLVIRQPIGVVAAIVPWNYPVSLMSWKVAPALAAGCTVVVKPPELAPLATTKTIEVLSSAGLPTGAVNVVTGKASEIGDFLVSHPITRVVALTGSTEIGAHIMRVASDGIKKLILELGGHTPMVVFKDANLERALKDGVKRSFRNMGQICNAVNRIYVEQDIAEVFIDRFVKMTEQMTIGDGLANPSIDLGPMIDQSGIVRTQRHVDDALQKGARLATGGGKPDAPELQAGYFYKPTVLTEVRQDMLVMHEETFGPLVGIATFKGVEEAIALANSTDFGLVTYGYTESLSTAFAFGEGVESGTVAINTVSPDSLYAPYPAWKLSGTGLELSRHGMNEYMNVKHLLLEIG
ncbi:MAG: NAD-dependent succinate-semialdehyde dehydrogenase [Anaerolineae bacterium]|nr:MAG: NAD-dependent succinate-semialdehyde dehydrogenase [Anaerolineae bacterium]